MRVEAEGKAGVGVTEVLGDGLHGFAGVDEHLGVEVPQCVYSIVRAGLDTCLDEDAGVTGGQRFRSSRCRSGRTRRSPKSPNQDYDL